MTETTDPHRPDDVARLQREIAELRHDLAYLTRSSLRQDKQHLALRTTVRELTHRLGHQMPNLQTDMLIAKARITCLQDQQHKLNYWAAWVEGWLGELDMWAQHLAHRFWPKAQALHGSQQIKRIFPNGFATIPKHRLPKGLSDRQP